MASQDFVPINSLLSLSDKTAIVTGGSSGIGFAISYRLCEAGAAVYIADIDSSAGQLATEELHKFSYQAEFVHCDVSQEKDVREMVNKVAIAKGKINILVNNAGIYPRKDLTETTQEQFDSIISINLKGAFLCAREVGKQMIATGKGGCIVNIASIDALHPISKNLAAYGASKGAVLTFTKSLALEFGQHDIRVNAIAPGGILTANVQSYMSAASASEERQLLKSFMTRMPLGRMGRPDDVARAALFLISEMASYITGTVVIVDGGYLIS